MNATDRRTNERHALRNISLAS